MLKKNDIKYIIKRVIIILLTGFVFYFINSCSVKAEELHNIYLYNTKSSSLNSLIGTSLANNYSVYHTFNLPYNSNYRINMSFDSAWVNLPSNYYYAIFYNSDLDSYYYLIIYDINNNYTSQDYDLSKINIQSVDGGYYYQYYNYYMEQYNTISGLNKSFVVSDSQVDLSSYVYSTPTSSFIDNEYYIYLSSSIELLFSNTFSLFEDFTLYSTNLTSFSINGVEQDLPSSIPSGYTEVDMTGYQGVVFVPKNYSSLDITTIEIDTGGDYNKYINYYRFPFYYTGCVNYGYFPLNNTSSLVVDTSSMSMCNNSPTFFNGLFPIYYNDDDLSSYAYNGVIVYNRNINNISNDNVVYLSSSVWYVSSMFDYYLVEDFSTFTGSFTFNDRDGNEMSIDFTRMYSFEDILNGINIDEVEDLDNLTTKQKISAILEFFKTPVNFMKKIYNGTCEPLRARFPHSNQDIVLPCLSSQFEEFLSPAAYSIIRLLINGLLTYRILNTMLLFFVSFINPDSTIIEVIDL